MAETSPKPKLRPENFGPAGVAKKRTLLRTEYKAKEKRLDSLLSKKGKLTLAEDKERRQLVKDLQRLGTEMGSLKDYEGI